MQKIASELFQTLQHLFARFCASQKVSKIGRNVFLLLGAVSLSCAAAGDGEGLGEGDFEIYMTTTLKVFITMNILF